MQGCLPAIIKLMDGEGPGQRIIEFCMASALAMLVLDEEVMNKVKDRAEAPLMFEHCIESVKVSLDRLNPLTDSVADDPPLTVRIAEACAQAMWGAAYYCTLPGGGVPLPRLP